MEESHGCWRVHDAQPPARPRLRRGPRARPRHARLPRPHRLRRGMDRLPLHGADGAMPRARPAGRPGAAAHRTHPGLAGRLHAALPPPGRASAPDRLARPYRARALLHRGGLKRDSDRLADVRHRWVRRPEPRDDRGIPRHHDALLGERRPLRVLRQVLGRTPAGGRARWELRIPHRHIHQAAPADRDRRLQPGFAHAGARRPPRLPFRSA